MEKLKEEIIDICNINRVVNDLAPISNIQVRQYKNYKDLKHYSNRVHD